jgi:hypothetical protein
MTPILFKEQSKRFYELGIFGNKVRHWDTKEDLLKSKCPLFTIRSRIPGGTTHYNVTPKEVQRLFSIFNIVEKDCYFSESINPKKVLLNAEFSIINGKLYLHYSTVPDHMKTALTVRPQEAFGLRAKEIVNNLTCDIGRETIWNLMDIYEDHVIEFTVCSEAFGDLGWRTMIWEVRKY